MTPHYSEVIALVRKPLLKTHRKLKTVITTFDNLESELSNIHADDVYCCLGTTIKKAGSQEAFKKVDHTLVVTVAELMKKQGAEQFLVISAMGANKDSKVFYNRVKGRNGSSYYRNWDIHAYVSFDHRCCWDHEKNSVLVRK